MSASRWEAKDYEPLLRERLPGWLARRLEVSSVELGGLERLAGGFSSETWKVIGRYRSGGEREEVEFILRWGPNGGIAAPYDMPGQFALLKALVPTPVPAPVPLWLEPDRDVLGEPFLTMKPAPGTTVPRFLDPADPLRQEKRRSHVRALASIHQLDWRSYGIHHVLQEPTPEDCAQVALSEVIRIVGNRGYAADPAVKRTISWLSERLPGQSEVTFIHGDPNLSNYRFDGTSVVAVLDWEMAKLRSPLWDIGFICAGIASLFGEEAQGLRERQTFLDLYQEATGRSFEQLLFWEVLFTLRAASGANHPSLQRRANRPGSYWPRLERLTI